jgi:amino acid permease
MAVSDLGVILSIVGATGSTLVSFILPGFSYYFIFSKEPLAPKWKLYLSLFQGCIGIIIMPLCLTFIFV